MDEINIACILVRGFKLKNTEKCLVQTSLILSTRY